MPFLDLNGTRLNYCFDGPQAAPVLVLSNSLGTYLAMWEPRLWRGKLRSVWVTMPERLRNVFIRKTQ